MSKAKKPAPRKPFRRWSVDAKGYLRLANLHSEVSELWEAYRKGLLHEGCDKGELTCAEEELADIVIRAMDTAVALGVDIGRAIAAKSTYNETRPHRHGGKRA